MFDEGKNALMITHLKKTFFPIIIMTKLPSLKTTVVYCHYAKEVKMYFIAKIYKVFKLHMMFYTISPIGQGQHKIIKPKNFKVKMIKILLYNEL